MSNDNVEWVEIFRSGTDYEAALVYALLQDADIPAVILNQRDHAFNLTHGYLAKVKVMIPQSMQEIASQLLASSSITEDELTEEALKHL